MGRKKLLKEDKVKKDAIIVNNVFVGGYGSEKGNLPHEMINFFRADSVDGAEGKFYVYVTPYGVINKEYRKEDLKGFLFVRSAGDTLVEVLAKAVVGSDGKDDFYTQGITLNEDNNPKFTEEEERDYYKNMDSELKSIKYGGVELSSIHNDNKKDNRLFVTMRVEAICLPKKTFYLTHKKEKTKTKSNVFFVGDSISDEGEGLGLEVKSGKKMANQSMKVYFERPTDEDYERSAYKKINDVFDNDELWLPSVDTPKYDSKSIVDDKSFFKVTRQQDNEVMFSNVFYYMFSEYPGFAKYLFSKLQNKNNKDVRLCEGFAVEREKDRMDIRIIDSNTYIIVENKIKSSINGIHTEADDGKSKDKDKTNKRENYTYKDGIRADADGKYLSQLSEYYEKAEKSKKTIHAYIFLPNYSTIDDEYLDNYLRGKEYSIVRYSEIFSCMEDYIREGNDGGFAKDLYVKDFLIAMKKHTEPTDNEHRNELMLRLKERIDKYNKTN